MTTIAWDGNELAADTLCAAPDGNFRCSKLWKVGKYLIGCAGNMDSAELLVRWFVHGALKDDFPEVQMDKSLCSTMLVIANPDEIWRYDQGYIPSRIKEKFYAIGTGSHCALTAMYLGKTAKEAVQVAHRFDCFTGIEVEAISFRDIVNN